jgi:hypothetical protein
MVHYWGEIYIDKIETTNKDVSFFTPKKVDWDKYEKIFPQLDINCYSDIRSHCTIYKQKPKAYTVLDFTKGAIMIISNERNLLYSQKNTTTSCENIPKISGVN